MAEAEAENGCVQSRAIPGNVPMEEVKANRSYELLEQNRRLSTPFMIEKTQREADKAWDKFYKAHQDKFFKNRNWTDREFKELRYVQTDSDEQDNTQVTTSLLTESPVLLEVGCGVGNTIYPLLEKNQALRVHCCDFSPRAVQMVEKHPLYDTERVNAFVYDLVKERTSELLQHQIRQRSWLPITTLSLIFVLSAIPPQEHIPVLRSLVHAIPVGASVVFRDYARGDLAQVRFHTRRDAQWSEPSLLSDTHDWYRRGDHTMAYYFTVAQVEALFQEVGGVSGHVEEVVKISTNRRTGAVMDRRFIQAQMRRDS
ncbi:hypothetical protein MYAM1_002576 [Malassezia yamatoensis]|uniref:tRNA N(3)-methylcytidine methyltransferase n=1 Tax=Malassezia yamatoensis TaxID=253288 RepID=A0AAJ5YUV2_9BASI|nr:hypothetical protein MYAM1_002576 [Malassezia yamatoensis]